jgi:L-ascorbate metabolism protein UlaG (beta-lactamase superfamily)
MFLTAIVCGPAFAQPTAPPAAAPGAARPAPAEKGRTELTWYGHAAFRIKTPSGKSILIDPWIDNPANANGKADLTTLSAVAIDLILVSHGHEDHVGNALDLARKSKAKLVATYDLGKALMSIGYPAAQVGMDTQGNFGGTIEALDGEVAITFVPAVHSSQVTRDARTPGLDGGAPGGFLISIKDGPTLYHTGDTDVFADMALIRGAKPVDYMLACIGGHFTMDPARAAKAVKLVKPRQVVPMHFGTFPLLKGTPDELVKMLRKEGAVSKVKSMNVGQTLQL